MECIEKIKPPEELNPRQRRAILYLLSCRTVKEAAAKAKVRLPTLYRWMKEPLFYNELERMRDEVVSDTVAKLKVHSSQAVSVLVDLMENSQSDQVKRGSASDLLENMRSFVQQREMEQRLTALEAALLNQTQGVSNVYKSYA